MSFFDELAQEKPLFQSDLAVGGHPVATETKVNRQEYLNLVALISQADEETHPSEKAMLHDLGAALEISESQVAEVLNHAAHSSKAEVEGALARWRALELRHILFVDLCRMASADAELKAREQSSLKWIASKLGLSGEQFKALLEFALWLRTPAHESEGDVRARLKQAGVPVEMLTFLFEDRNKSAEALASALLKEATPTAEGQPSSLPIQAIREAQEAILSHLNRLAKYVTACRPTGAGSYALGTSEQLDSYIAQIEEEKQKVEHLRMTLAVIGPMKAGKSTVINAIIGDEILPTRSGAMTTLPTLITHTAGCHEPILRFKKSQPFNDLLESIRENLERIETPDGRSMFGEHADFAPTLNRIRSGELLHFEETYKGRVSIHALLHDLNDLVRISQHESMLLESPLSQYQQIEDFPEIEVEFTYLHGRVGESLGRLSLVDTPGPNEAGQGHLKSVVKEQLRASTAVLVVVSPAELDSEAFQEINHWLREARTEHGTPLYIFCNKYDEMRSSERKGNRIEQKCITKFPDIKMANGEIHSVSGRVFAVCAKWGLLANRVLRTLEREETLPSYEFPENSWVEDFASQAYGNSQEPIDALKERDREVLRTDSRRMWDNSLMARPLQEVVATSLHRAAPICLEHAVDRITRIGEDLQKKAHGTRTGLDKGLRELELTLTNMKRRLQELNQIREELKPLCDDTLKLVKSRLSETLRGLKGQVDGTLTKLSQQEQERMQREDEEYSHSGKGGFEVLHRFLSGRSKSEVRRVLTEDDPIRFSTEEEARKFVESVQKAIKKAAERVLQSGADDLEPIVVQCQEDISSRLKERVTPVMDEFRKEFKREFDVELETPAPKLPRIFLDLDMLATMQIRRETVTKIRFERRWYTLLLCRHEVRYEETEFKIAPKKVRESIQESLKAQFEDCKKLVLDYIKSEFAEQMRTYFDGLDSQIELAKDVASDAIAAKQNDKQTQEAIKRELCRKSEQFAEFGDSVKETSARLQAAEA